MPSSLPFACFVRARLQPCRYRRKIFPALGGPQQNVSAAKNVPGPICQECHRSAPDGSPQFSETTPARNPGFSRGPSRSIQGRDESDGRNASSAHAFASNEKKLCHPEPALGVRDLQLHLRVPHAPYLRVGFLNLHLPFLQSEMNSFHKCFLGGRCFSSDIKSPLKSWALAPEDTPIRRQIYL